MPVAAPCTTEVLVRVRDARGAILASPPIVRAFVGTTAQPQGGITDASGEKVLSLPRGSSSPIPDEALEAGRVGAHATREKAKRAMMSGAEREARSDAISSGGVGGRRPPTVIDVR